MESHESHKVSMSEADAALANLLFGNAVERMANCLSLAATQDFPAWTGA